jgi:hypothetical protein
LLAETSLGFAAGRLRLRHERHHARVLASQDLLAFEIPAIRDDLEILAADRGLRLLRHRRPNTNRTMRIITAGVVVSPGFGFDVIPTDCVARALAEALPDATHLALGFETLAGMSPGTAKTSVEGLAAAARSGATERSRWSRLVFVYGRLISVTGRAPPWRFREAM